MKLLKGFVFGVLMVGVFVLSSCSVLDKVRPSGSLPSNSLLSSSGAFDPYSDTFDIEKLNKAQAVYVADIDELSVVIEESMKKREKNIFVRSYSFDVFSDYDLLDMFGFKSIYSNLFSTPNGVFYAFLQVEYYPGENVVYAYNSLDKSLLNEVELELYSYAVDFIDSLDDSMSDMEKEIAIHNYICEKLNYRADFLGREDAYNVTTAYSLITGTANCQGYTDAFYMLTNMAGLQCEKAWGWSNGIAHTWNIIKIDGIWSYVDVTFDDIDFDIDNEYFFAYLNVPREYLEDSHIFSEFNKHVTDNVYDNFYYVYKGIAVFNDEDFRRLVYEPLSSGVEQLEVFILSEDIQDYLDSLKALNLQLYMSYFHVNKCTLLAISTS